MEDRGKGKEERKQKGKEKDAFTCISQLYGLSTHFHVKQLTA